MYFAAMRQKPLILVSACLCLLVTVSSCHRKSVPEKSTGGKTSGSTSSSSGKMTKQTGKASYYADKFDGRKTANGEIFSQKKLTAAHRTLPFGTMVTVKNLANGKSVTVRINDRGPFAGNRLIDLSRAAANAIDMVKQGVVSVEIAYRK